MSEFKVGQRVRIISAVGSLFLRTGDIGTVVAIDGDGDVWARWENPLQTSHNNVWCSLPSRLEIIDEYKERLIASAPELLEALRDAAQALSDAGVYGGALDRAIDVIAQATGE